MAKIPTSPPSPRAMPDPSTPSLPVAVTNQRGREVLSTSAERAGDRWSARNG